MITGAGGGIGRAISIKLASLGASVAVSDIDEVGLKDTFHQLPQSCGQTHAAKIMDVRRKNHIVQMAEWLRQTYGHLDILVNNAGVSTMNHLTELSEEEWDFIFDVNVKSIFLVTQALVPLMPQGGRIINTCSMAAVKPDPMLPHYTASKFAVLGLTKAMALEFASRQINVNCVCPGYVKTKMQEREIVWEGDMRGISPEQVLAGYISHTPLGRLCMPEDVADVVSFLTSPQAKFLTGEAINVAGGANL